jgi:CheY-like chemotaxis protein
MSKPVLADMAGANGREIWDVPVPLGGWGTPWPQCLELARALPSNHWTLVGGLMVQLHSAAAGLAVSRPTADVDIVLHVETGTATTTTVSAVLRSLGYELEPSIDHDAPAHRFVRGKQQIDVMIADYMLKEKVPTLGGRKPFQVSGGTQALQRAVNCRLAVDEGEPVPISIPNALGALVLKGAAYREDSRDKGRHLDDAVVLCATIRTPLATAKEMKGSDKSRILTLHKALEDPGHRSWQLLEPADRTPAMDALRILASNLQLPPANRLKKG